MKILSLKIWIPLIVIGVLALMFMPAYMPNKGVPTHEINWQAIIGEVCVGLGSLAACIRGIVELVHLFKK
jgi:uncharacterized membrane protein YqhA